MSEYIDTETGLFAYQGDILLAHPEIDPVNFIAPNKYALVIDAPKPLLPFDEIADLVLVEENGVYKKTWVSRKMTAEELQNVQDLIAQRDALIAKKLAEAKTYENTVTELEPIVELINTESTIVETGDFVIPTEPATE